MLDLLNICFDILCTYNKFQQIVQWTNMDFAVGQVNFYINCPDGHVEILGNKKVLLRERKRHTARRVASARGGGVPCRRSR